MAREIKFRAWCEKLGMVCNVLSIDFLNKDVLVVYDETRANQLVLHEGEFELLQFTGLFDKQGVEVYEGDIVKIRYVSRPIEVIYSTILASFLIGNEHRFTALQDIEVIGNIYENRELLDG